MPSCLYNLSKIKKKRKISSNPVFHQVKVASPPPPAKLYHPLYSSDETVTLVLHSIPTTSFLKITSDQSADHSEQSEKLCWGGGEKLWKPSNGRNKHAHTHRDWLVSIRIDRSMDKQGSILLAIRKHLLELGFGDWPPRCLRQTLQLNIREWRVGPRDWINLHCSRNSV